MWVSKGKYETDLKRTSKLEVELQSKIEQISRLEREIDYWRGKFESAQNRADRIVDKSLSVSGIGPVSDLGMKELDETMGKYAKMMKDAENQSTEMFGEEIRAEGTENLELEIEPQLVNALVDGLRE